MEQNNKNFAKGIFLSKKKSSTGKDYFELSIKNGEVYDKYTCFESQRIDKYGNILFTIYNKTTKDDFKSDVKKEDLPF